jgi:hypothetical protein
MVQQVGHKVGNLPAGTGVAAGGVDADVVARLFVAFVYVCRSLLSDGF